MARHLKLSVEDAHDENSVVIPDVKAGDAESANYILSGIGSSTRIKLGQAQYRDQVMPDVTGMGARDAVYLLERRGLKVRLHGRGAVKSQSYPAGRAIVAGSECVLTLQ